MGAVVFYKDSCFLYEKGKFDSCNGKKLKDFPVGALIPSHKILALSFKLPLHLSQEQLAVQTELKLYNEGGLDPNKEYAIDYLAYPIEHENSYLVEAFAIVKEELENYLQEPLKKLGFIDIVFPRFIAYKAFYDTPANTNDIFFYLADEEAFVAIYQNGKFIGHRNIDSFSQIAKKSGIELVRIKNLLFSKGLRSENYSLQESDIYDKLQEIFYKNIEKVAYSINFKRSFFGIDRVDRIFLDADGQMIDGLRDYFVSFGIEGALEVKPFACCSVEAQSASLAVAAAYIQKYEQLDQKLNFTLFERKKPLVQFEVVQLALALFVVLLIGTGAWIWLQSKIDNLESQIAFMQQQYEKNRHNSKKYEGALLKLKEQQKKLLAAIDSKETQIDEIADTLDAIPFIENAKTQRQKMINDAILGLYTYKLSTKSIEQNGTKRLGIDVISQTNQREKIAKFMQFMIQKGYANVQTKEIVMDRGLYESHIEVVR
ncbi:hypothetical protein [Nitratiruptor sp. YY09-18]|uniref:hypothetical protein n=1 Tax=Nitratiruptor sp. YY09-18 TaxID=2724901 RepID=UPI0019168523|nr:hypothetical protein [Nitratiruptor sp. YY09-18]BCD68675.1 hypothetical protein NitYY0918_C1592 [Nitratiruptor sp. YY09-18]